MTIFLSLRTALFPLNIVYAWYQTIAENLRTETVDPFIS